MLKKKELLAEVGKKASVNATTVSSVVDGLVEVVKEELNKNEKITIPGLCTFKPSIKEAAKRQVRIPTTGETVMKEFPAKVVVKIKPDKKLAEAIVEPLKRK